MAIPLVLPDSAVSSFKFYRDSDIHEGILYGRKIYKLDSAFDASLRHQSFQVAKGLAQKNKVVLTTGQVNYRIWVALS